MLKNLQFWTLSVVGAACVALSLANIALFTANRGLQGQVSGRGQYIQQSAQLQGLYRQIAQALADLSVRNKDPQLQAILARQGLHVTVHPQSPAAAAGAAAPPAKQAGQHDGAHHHE
jgi:hypothetical protein